MALTSFQDWLAKESSAFTRRRDAAAKGLAPPIPAAALDSHSTAPPWMRSKKHLSKVIGKSNIKKVDESNKNANPKASNIDTWLEKLAKLKDTIDGIKDLDKKEKDKKPESKPDKKEVKGKETDESDEDNDEDDTDNEEKDIDKKVAGKETPKDKKDKDVVVLRHDRSKTYPKMPQKTEPPKIKKK